MPSRTRRDDARSSTCPVQRPAAVLDDRAAVEDALVRLRGTVDDLSEDDAPDVHDEALRSGVHVVCVPARDEDDGEGAAGALRAAGGHDLVHSGPVVTGSGWRRP